MIKLLYINICIYLWPLTFPARVEQMRGGVVLFTFAGGAVAIGRGVHASVTSGAGAIVVTGYRLNFYLNFLAAYRYNIINYILYVVFNNDVVLFFAVPYFEPETIEFYINATQ